MKASLCAFLNHQSTSPRPISMLTRLSSVHSLSQRTCSTWNRDVNGLG